MFSASCLTSGIGGNCSLGSFSGLELCGKQLHEGILHNGLPLFRSPGSYAKVVFYVTETPLCS